MNRVVVSRPIVGFAHMQVCAVADATDEEILLVCNSENPSGTSMGWSSVLRGPATEFWEGESKAPVACADDAGRLHLIVGC